MTDEVYNQEDWDAGAAFCERWEGTTYGFEQPVGALVRLVRGLLALLESMAVDEIAEIYSKSMDPDAKAKAKERIDLLSEARKLVGENEVKP